jgi:hypothetical protein
MINALTRNVIEIATSQEAITDMQAWTGHPLTWLKIGNIALYAVVLAVMVYVVLKHLNEKRG